MYSWGARNLHDPGTSTGTGTFEGTWACPNLPTVSILDVNWSWSSASSANTPICTGTVAMEGALLGVIPGTWACPDLPAVDILNLICKGQRAAVRPLATSTV